MKKLFVFLVILLAVVSFGCNTDNGTDPGSLAKGTKIMAYYVTFNKVTNQWDMSTKILLGTFKFDDNKNYYERFFNNCFTKNKRDNYSFIGGNSSLNNHLNNLGCFLSAEDFQAKAILFYHNYDNSGFLSKIGFNEDSTDNDDTMIFGNDKGKLMFKVQKGDTIYFEYGSNSLISKSFYYNSCGKKRYGEYFYHDNQGFLVKDVDSTHFDNDESIVATEYSYNSLGDLIKRTFSTSSIHSSLDFITEFTYNKDGLCIQMVSDFETNQINEYVFDKNYNLIEAIISNLNGEKSKVIYEYSELE